MERLLVLARHGQSEWNLKNLFTGWRNPDLTALGVEEARKAGRFDVLQACNPPDIFWPIARWLRRADGTRFVFDHHDLCPELFDSRFPEGRSLARRGLVGGRDADDVGTGIGRGDDLRQRGLHVGAVGVGHGLHADRRAAAHRHPADHDLPRTAAFDVAPGTDRVVGHGLACAAALRRR